MNRQKRIKRKRLEELKRKVKREIIKLSIVFVAGVGYGRYALNYNDNVVMAETPKETPVQETLKQVEPQNTPTFEETSQIETKQEEEYKCTLQHETACKIKKKAEEYGVDWKMAVSISAWETGYWTSSLYHNNKNIGGLYCKEFLKYNTLDEGIEAFVSNLKRNYYDKGLNTIEKIGAKYCPVGASNDPTGLNKNWIPGVTKIYNSLEGE